MPKTAEGHGTDFCHPVTRQKIAATQAGEKGYQWRGEDVGYSGIHKRARAVLPAECSHADDTCKGYLEVALRPDAVGPFREDKRGIYSPQIEDYRMLCRSHHNREHGRVPPWRREG
jgi:hypothetical protein